MAASENSPGPSEALDASCRVIDGFAPMHTASRALERPLTKSFQTATQKTRMATKHTVPFDELARLASEFVTQQQGMWDHSAWLDFLARAQGGGIEMSADMQANLGGLLEAMKEYHTAVSSTEDIEKAMSAVFENSVDFVTRHQGVWGHGDWEDFVRTMQENTRTWSKGMEAYLGSVLESLKVFYALYPTTTVKESVSGARSLSAREPSVAPATTPAGNPDDLTAIAGLGPAIAKKLRQEGIVSYAQLAALSQGEIARLEKDVIKSSGRFKRDDWVGQARLLAHA
jgi:predicted flap endonuclease-1-like 5' DNA nuclease